MALASRPAMTVPAREGVSAVRCSFVHLGTAYANQPGDTPKFQITCMFNKQDPVDFAVVQLLANDLEAVRVEQFPNEATRPRTPVLANQPGQGPKSPIKDGDVAVDGNGRLIKEKNPEYAGHYIVAASNTRQVSVVGPDAGRIDANMCRSGYWYKVSLNAYAYTNNGGGVTVGLNGAQLMREDQVIGGGGPSVDEMFAPAGGQDPNQYGQPAAGVQQPAPAFQQPVNPTVDPAFQQPVNPAVSPAFQPAQPAPVAQPAFQPAQPAPVAPPVAQPAFQQPVNPAVQPAQPAFQQPAQIQPAPVLNQPGQPVAQPLQQPGSIV